MWFKISCTWSKVSVKDFLAKDSLCLENPTVLCHAEAPTGSMSRISTQQGPVVSNTIQLKKATQRDKVQTCWEGSAHKAIGSSCPASKASYQAARSPLPSGDIPEWHRATIPPWRYWNSPLSLQPLKSQKQEGPRSSHKAQKNTTLTFRWQNMASSPRSPTCWTVNTPLQCCKHADLILAWSVPQGLQGRESCDLKDCIQLVAG